MKREDFHALSQFFKAAPADVAHYRLSYKQIELIIRRSLVKYAKEQPHFWTRRIGQYTHVHDYAEAWYDIGWNAKAEPVNRLVVFSRCEQQPQ